MTASAKQRDPAEQDRVMKALADGADSVTIEKKEIGTKYDFLVGGLKHVFFYLPTYWE